MFKIFRYVNYSHSPLFGALAGVMIGIGYFGVKALKSPDINLKLEKFKVTLPDFKSQEEIETARQYEKNKLYGQKWYEFIKDHQLDHQVQHLTTDEINEISPQESSNDRTIE